MKPHRLLAVTDLSAPARHAVERAAMLSGETGASLDLFHVANLAPLEKLRKLVRNAPKDMEQRVLDIARKKLDELAEDLLKRYGLSVGRHVTSGALLTELVNETDKCKPDLVVCGARGESFVRHMLLGSTAERMLSRTRYPILVVKQVAHESYRTVLIPVDFSSSSLRAIENARSIAPLAKILLMHSFDPVFEGHLRYACVDDVAIERYRNLARQEAISNLHELAKNSGLPEDKVRFVAINGDPGFRIIEQEQEMNCDLIVMGKHGENMVEELLLGSVTKRVLSESQCDVLVSV